MITSEPIYLAVALGVGLLTGGLFFAGLWLTTQRFTTSDHPALLMLTSFVLRMALVLGAFFLVGRGHLDRIVFCLIGFLVARFVAMHMTREKVHQTCPNRKEASHEPQS